MVLEWGKPGPRAEREVLVGADSIYNVGKGWEEGKGLWREAALPGAVAMALAGAGAVPALAASLPWSWPLWMQQN